VPNGRYTKLLLALAIACQFGAAGKYARAEDARSRASGPAGWTQPFKNPVIKAGDLRSQALWNDPDVHKENGLYIIYMTTSVEEPFKPPVLPFRAVSRDGFRWKLEPETPLVTTAGTPFASIETPSVVKFRNQYHMFFTAVYKNPPSAPKDFAIGHAQSPDSIHWTIDSEPVLTATGNVSDWNGYIVSEPGAIVRGNQIFVYFCATGGRASGHPPQLQAIGLAKTQDGKHFSPPVSVLGQSPLYPPEQGYTGYSTPSAFELNGKIHLVYDVAQYKDDADPNWQQVALQHAVSPDGETNFVQDQKPIFTRGDFSWAGGEVIGPSALVDGGEVKLWFAGHVPVNELGRLIQNNFSGEDFGIGYAVRSLSDFR